MYITTLILGIAFKCVISIGTVKYLQLLYLYSTKVITLWSVSLRDFIPLWNPRCSPIRPFRRCYKYFDPTSSHPLQKFEYTHDILPNQSHSLSITLERVSYHSDNSKCILTKFAFHKPNPEFSRCMKSKAAENRQLFPHQRSLRSAFTQQTIIICDPHES